MNKPLVAVVMVNTNGATTMYKGRPLIDTCMKTLKKTVYKNFKTVIVDGYSTDNSVDYIKNRFKSVTLIVDKENYGYSRSLNGGIMFAIKKYNPKYIVLFSTDIIVRDAMWLDNLVKFAESNNEAGIVGCKLVYPNGLIQAAGMDCNITVYNIGRAERDVGQYDYVKEVKALTTAAVLVRQEVVEKIGLLDGNFFIGYDDIDYCFRARDAGFRIIYNGKISLVHLEGFTSTASSDPKRRDMMVFMNTRNYVYFSLKYFPAWKIPLALSVSLLACIVSIEGKDRQRLSSIRLKDRILWRIVTTLRATIAAYKIYRSHIRIDYKNEQSWVAKS